MKPSEKPLISELEIQARARELAVEISRDYADKNLLALVVLKGAAFFAADLLKHLHCGLAVEFVRAQSYDGTASTGTVEFRYWPDCAMQGRHILILEDILDTGRTCAAIFEKVREQKPASIEICTLLDKPTRRTHPLTARYTGFTINDHFVVGYGLDYNESYRNLPSIHLLEKPP